LLESLLTSSENTLKSNEYLEDAITQRLLNNARFIKEQFDKNQVTNETLKKTAQNYKLFSINIFNKNGERIHNSHPGLHIKSPPKSSFTKVLNPIFYNEADTVIIGLKEARMEEGFRYAVAVASKNNDAIVVNIDAIQLLNFRKSVGFGKLLQKIAGNEGIEYVALQDTTGILAASGNIQFMNSLNSSPFLIKSVRDSVFQTRIINFNNKEVFEAVHPLYYYNNPIGIYRIGLSLDALSAINSRIKRRIFIISIILTFIGTVMFFLMLSKQNISLLKKQYKTIETYSSRIINNVSDAILVIDEQKNVGIFNQNAQNLFQKKMNCPFPLSAIFNKQQQTTILETSSTISTISWEIEGKPKQLLISKSHFTDENDSGNIIIAIRDITKIKQLEEQIKRKEQLSAMGALASGVAHEIRNPLNTISTIIQQLNMDFEPAENADEYHSLAGLIYGEIKRINKTIQDFLHFSKPEPLELSKFSLPDFLNNIEKQHYPLCREHDINLIFNSEYSGDVSWDKNKIKQVFTNLIQNAVNVMDKGNINVEVKKSSRNHLTIIISDDGPGIPIDILPKIFNLYFTTRANGTGIGLSIVQKIIDEHFATISVNSATNKETTFTINIPIVL
ncbi:MAG: hypothetical protein KAR38_17220, partial [Calditrichia bacterium]|nr:hypothetical protein [Calditrichia bacterium]